MYRQFFGLQERPFDLTVNPRFLFLSAGHREALSLVQYGLEAEKGISLLIGDAGTGKTTLLRSALDQQRGSRLFTVYLNNPTLSRGEFYEFLAGAFHLRAAAHASKTVFLREIEQFLIDRQRAGGLTTLIVDEAQAIPDDMLEEIRLLANLESSTRKLLSVVLAGQPELAERLKAPELRPLKQRVALRSTLPPFTVRETAGYIAKRLKVAGGEGGAIFTREAVEAIHFGAQGIPRTISVICDNALITAFALQQRPVDAEIVMEVCGDLDLDANVPQLPWRPVPVNDDPAPPERGESELLAPPRPLSIVNPAPHQAADEADDERPAAEAARMPSSRPGSV